MGKPWAGQRRATVIPFGLLILDISDSDDKAGLLDPTGSEEIYIYLIRYVQIV